MQEKIFYNDIEIDVIWNRVDSDALVLSLSTPSISILLNVERINIVIYKFKNVKEDLPTYKDLNIFLEKKSLKMIDLLTFSFNKIL